MESRFRWGTCGVGGRRLFSCVQQNQPSLEKTDGRDDVDILVIEDNADDQELLLRRLQKSGVQERVLCVENGSEALELIRHGARKLSAACAIFLDLSLPGVNGLLLLQAIRSNVETALLPVIVMTGSTNPKDEAECRRLGVTGFVSKRLLSLPSFSSTLTELLSGTKSRPIKKT
jgi:two-component system response regulator